MLNITSESKGLHYWTLGTFRILADEKESQRSVIAIQPIFLIRIFCE